MFFDLPTPAMEYRGFQYYLDWDRSHSRRKHRGYVAMITNPKTGKTHSMGHGTPRIVTLNQLVRNHIDAIANCREGWNV